MILFPRVYGEVALWLNAIRKVRVLAYSSHNSQQEMQPFLFIV